MLPDRLLDAEAVIRSCTVIIDPKARLNVFSEDEPDNRIPECAVKGGSDTILTGDKHLLRRAEYQEISILPPHTFLREYSIGR